MTDNADIANKFWKSLKSDRTAMLWVEGTTGSRPMTVLADPETKEGPLWIFTSNETELVQSLAGSKKASLAFSSKGHDVFGSVDGEISISNDRTVIDRLWNPFVAAWFENGKDDPKLTLLRFDGTEAKVWIDGSSLLAGVKILLGVDPKKDYQDKVAKIDV